MRRCPTRPGVMPGVILKAPGFAAGEFFVHPANAATFIKAKCIQLVPAVNQHICQLFLHMFEIVFRITPLKALQKLICLN